MKFSNGCVDLVAVALDADVIVLDVDDEAVEECGQQIPAHCVGCAAVQLAGVAE
ncbi:hypothetical protein [Cryobacterium lyxosi]|uniref:hypothetical protein n=1 Tax=Cryobacterium lyxosi TaxID=1259228 RepID=UPI00141B52C8|nr:hypothetical protein [Cryobacterium lyxosi]